MRLPKRLDEMSEAGTHRAGGGMSRESNFPTEWRTFEPNCPVKLLLDLESSVTWTHSVGLLNLVAWLRVLGAVETKMPRNGTKSKKVYTCRKIEIWFFSSKISSGEVKIKGERMKKFLHVYARNFSHISNGVSLFYWPGYAHQFNQSEGFSSRYRSATFELEILPSPFLVFTLNIWPGCGNHDRL